MQNTPTLDLRLLADCQSISSTVDEENTVCLAILKTLEQALLIDMQQRQVFESILGIYFIDLLKLTTNLALGCSNMPAADMSNLVTTFPRIKKDKTKWPYVHGLHNYPNLEFGHQFSRTTSTRKKLLAAHASNLQIKIKRGGSKRFCVTSSALSPALLRWSSKNKICVDVVEAQNIKFRFRDLNLQIDKLSSTIEKIANTLNFPISQEMLFDIVRRHILANCEEGEPLDLIKNKIFLVGSGCEIENRLLSSTARYYDKSVINVFHGGSYGVQDKPTFSFGEQMLCTHLIVFGKQQFSNKRFHPTNFGFGQYEKVLPKQGANKVEKPKITDRLMYVPTSLRGATKRFGPFEDMPDGVYKNVWKLMRQIFGSELVIKLHPKNTIECDFDAPLRFEPLENILNEADTFIFDYHSTAFNIASGTNKPIVFLDFGLQSFTPSGLEGIKSRSIYFDMKQAPPHSFHDVIKRADEPKWSAHFVEEFISSNGKPTIDVATQHMIELLLQEG